MLDSNPKLYLANSGTILYVPEFDLEYKIWGDNIFPLPSPPEGVAIEVADWKYKPKFPKVERKLNIPESEILLTDVPSRARIYHKSGLILFDRELWDSLKVYERIFILLHERGHNYYHSEHKCDIFASQIMRRMGFPVSVILRAQLSTRKEVSDLHYKNASHFKKSR